MNNKIVSATFLTLALLILLPALSTVNATAQNAGSHSALVADGTPAPPPVPHPDALLVADGTPAPPPVPHPNVSLVADGTPAPPPVPHPALLPQSERFAA
jgi:hypothetical protein